MFDTAVVVEGSRRNMGIHALVSLSRAVTASRHGGGPRRLATRLRREGVAVLDDLLGELSNERRNAIAEEAQCLLDRGIRAAILGERGYPASLAQNRHAPPAFFFSGSLEQLHRPAIGICGSRHASPEGLHAAQSCSSVAVNSGLAVVSGYARGVDMAAHTAALAERGTTVIVLAEGIDHFRVRRGDFADVWDPSRAVVVSQFSPTQPWSAGAAMTRNTLISGLSRALVVVEAGETGGTLAAGLHALERGQSVIILRLFAAPAGNQILEDKGATPVHNRQELRAALEDLPSNATGQLSLI